MISKELLSEVFTDNQQEFNVIGVDKNLLKYQWLNEEPFGDGDINCKWVDMEINIHELAYKCKMKMFEWGFNIDTKAGAVEVTEYNRGEEKRIHIVHHLNKLFDPNADIEACQWILDNKGVKDD